MNENGADNPGADNLEAGSSGGSSGTEGGSGSQGDLQSKLDAAEQGKRHFQSLADQRAEQIKALEAKTMDESKVQQLVEASIQAALGTLKVPTVDEMTERVSSAVLAAQEAKEFRASVLTKYPEADPAVVKGASFEEMQAAAKASHDARVAAATEARQAVEAQVRADLAKRYNLDLSDGNGDASDQGDGGSPNGGELTLEKFLAMDDMAAAAVPDDVWKKLMGQAAEAG